MTNEDNTKLIAALSLSDKIGLMTPQQKQKIDEEIQRLIDVVFP